nr:NADH dehydrogenase subunit 4L [Striga asiatica]UXL88498.1 NADH dehydrogenase subunit 4L [Striga asiatica]
MMLKGIVVLSAYLFAIGVFGLITSRNLVRAFMLLSVLNLY